MKKLYFTKGIFIIIAFLFSFNISAQIEIPIAAHIVRKSNGTSPRVSSVQIDEEITRLTSAYSSMGITFTKCSENFIDNDFIWSQFDSGEDQNKLLLDTYTIKNVLNVFFTDLEGGSHGRAVFPYKQKDWVIVDYNFIGASNSTLIHEVGHYFGLHHTYSDVDEDNPASSSSLTISNAEGVNGWKFGDYLIDTPLDPENRDDYNNSCIYTGNQKDANGDAFHPDGTNYMGKGHGSCRSTFSLGQEKRILEYIERYRYYLECSNTSDNNLTCSNSTSVSTFPHNDNFERDVINSFWVQARHGDDMNWRNGPDTSSSSTGPSSAQNGQTFMYLEASLKYTTSDEAFLISPCYDFTTKDVASVEFYYHMYGSSTGTLELGISTDNGSSWTTLFSKSGQQHSSNASPWTKEVVNIDVYTGQAVQLRFKVIGTGSSKSDISIDNVTVNAIDSSLSIQDNEINGLKLFPNPVKDFLKIDSPKSILETIEVYNTLGALVYRKEVSLKKVEVNTSYLPNGLYLMKIKAINRKESVVKFIKN